MVLIVRYLYTLLADLSAKCYRDPRVRDLPLVGSPASPVIVIALYVLLVKKWGPAWMSDRKPFNVKILIQIHNVLQIALNTYGLIIALPNSYLRKDFSLTCQNVNYNDTSPATLRLVTATYVYYLTKYLDLFDTIFFVLRKKNSHISFLHVYHHSIMIIAVWMHLTFIFGSHDTMLGIVNAFVHVIMYSYYLVASLDLKIDFLPWKKRVTQIQIAQFCYLVVHFSLPIVNNWCNLKFNAIHVVAVIQNIFMACLFTDFYIKAYMQRGKNRKQIT